jgi:hypothetical protein
MQTRQPMSIARACKDTGRTVTVPGMQKCMHVLLPAVTCCHTPALPPMLLAGAVPVADMG